MLNVFGESPDRREPLPNAGTNARLAGAGNGHDTLVVANHFGAATYGLELTGPLACVSDNFFTPEVGAYGEAAVGRPEGRDERPHRQHGRLRLGLRPQQHFLYTSAGKPAVLDPRRRRRARAVELLRRRRGPSPRRWPGPRCGSRTPAPTSRTAA